MYSVLTRPRLCGIVARKIENFKWPCKDATSESERILEVRLQFFNGKANTPALCFSN